LLACLRPCRKLFHSGEGFGGRNREGAPEPPGVRKCAEVSGF